MEEYEEYVQSISMGVGRVAMCVVVEPLPEDHITCTKHKHGCG